MVGELAEARRHGGSKSEGREGRDGKARKHDQCRLGSSSDGAREFQVSLLPSTNYILIASCVPKGLSSN